MWKREKGLLFAGGAAGVLLLAAMVAGLFLKESLGRLLPVLGPLAAVALVLAALLALRLRTQAEELSEDYHATEPLTGLWNEQRLQEDFEALQDRRKQAMVLLRLTGGYRLNALFGEEASDDVVRRLAPYLTNFLRKNGGEGEAYCLSSREEFVLLAPYGEQALFLYNLKEALGQMSSVMVKLGDMEYLYRFSFCYGIYFLTEADSEVQEIRQILSLARVALSQLPESGETQELIFNEQNKPDWGLANELTSQVKSAWQKREFVPYYQLVYDLEQEKPVGAELLTRWDHPEHGVISPKEFLSAVESQGLIMDLDLYMLEEACKKIRGWIDRELVTVPIAVNISKLNFYRKGFVDRLISTVRTYEIPPILIELELTESVLIFENGSFFTDMMNRLRAVGFTISMDHFASSDFSSANLLRSLPLGVVKVNCSFFDRIGESDRDRLFVKNFLRMAAEMDVNVVVMGVESKEQVKLCKSMGCKFAQGFYFSKPMTNENFEQQIF